MKYEELNKDSIAYSFRHRAAFKAVLESLKEWLSPWEYEKLRGRALTHDTDKMWLYTQMPKDKAAKIHRMINKHHVHSIEQDKSTIDYLEMIIDWESARYTKPDKTLNAYDTLYGIYPEMEDEIKPLLVRLRLNVSEGEKDPDIMKEISNLRMTDTQIQEDIETGKRHYETLCFEQAS